MSQGTASAADATDTLAYPDTLHERETTLIGRRRTAAGIAADAPLLGAAFSGGGIRSAAQIEAAFTAGADIVVIGTAIEKDLKFLEEIKSIKR